jgi:murein L,D-transpeptidase YafK
MSRLFAIFLGVLAAGSLWAQNQAAPMAAVAVGAGRAEGTGDAGLSQADSIVVRKSERRLYLMRNGAVLRSFKVALGLRPEGHKEYEGDFRTPEGKYRLVRRNPQSEFFLSIQVSYPNEADIANAKRLGMRPGGNIMIHGRPNTPRKPPDYYASVDWTEGCISVSNSDMVEIWLMTPPDTPIEIVP